MTFPDFRDAQRSLTVAVQKVQVPSALQNRDRKGAFFHRPVNTGNKARKVFLR